MTRRYLTATATERNAGIIVAAVIGVGFIALIAEVRIDAQGVEYRGRSVPTGQVVEVVSADAICVCTPRRTLEIPHGFCDPQSTARVIDELRRVIGEMGRPDDVFRLSEPPRR